MNDEQRRLHERFNRVRNFCESLAPAFPVNSRSGMALEEIISAIKRSEELDAAQSTHGRERQQGTIRRKELRERLCSQLSAIGKTARVIGKEHAAVKDRFRLSGSRRNDQALLSTAKAFITEATPHKALFLEYDMPANFLEELALTIADFERAINQQSKAAGGRMQARAGIDQLQARATGELEKLDTAIRNRFRDDQAMLAAWESASRLERAPRSPSAAEESEENPAPPAP